MDTAMAMVVIGGLLEPVWVVALKKYNTERNFRWIIATVFFAILSPAMMGIGMKTISVGIAYAVWTGIGAVCTMIVGYALYKDRVGAVKLACVGLILVGVVGLELVSGGARWTAHGHGS